MSGEAFTSCLIQRLTPCGLCEGAIVVAGTGGRETKCAPHGVLLHLSHQMAPWKMILCIWQTGVNGGDIFVVVGNKI